MNKLSKIYSLIALFFFAAFVCPSCATKQSKKMNLDSGQSDNSVSKSRSGQDLNDASIAKVESSEISNVNTIKSSDPSNDVKPFPVGTFEKVESEVVYYVKVGDTLSDISKLVYGGPDHWKKIANYNRLENPHLLYPLDQIKLPVVNTHSKKFAHKHYGKSDFFSTKVSNKQMKPKHLVEAYNKLDKVKKMTTKVRKGETLFNVAERTLGDGNLWPMIWWQNKDQIDDPNLISIGQTINFVDPKSVH